MAAEPGGLEGPEQEGKYRRFVSQAKEEARNGNLEESLSLFRKALEIRPSEKLTKNIKKLEEALASLALDEEDDGFVDVCQSGLMLYGEMYENLFEHQREGVAFLYSLFRDGRKGGILADDMGLGKTIQIIAFLSGMFDAEHIRYVLLVMPTTLVSNWIKEFDKWTPGLRVKVFHGKSIAERKHHLERIQRKNGVLLTTYQMLLNNWQQLSSFGEKQFVWDYVILDEAHKIKTPSAKTTKCLHAIPSKHRILLTGTPIQNNLKELWALFDFACQGSLLGTMKTFKMEYEDPITAARAKDATLGEKALGLKISENLMSLIKPYFLRRSKEELQKKAKSEPKCSLPGEPDKVTCLAMPSLPRKNDFIVWVYLAPIQEEIYRKFVSLDHIQELLMTTRSPLAQLNVLKKLCDHPRLLPAQACSQLGLEMSKYNESNGGEREFLCPNTEHVPDELLIEESGKLGFLLALLARLQEEGHRTLVFSQSRKMLDIIERILTRRHFQLLRIDGTVSHLMEREKRIGMFQKDKDYSVFLLTTQVGGVGITLTAATRVVIFDPSWNPAVDAQAVDRVYRIGQEENVVVYRLITCGTLEEKIYRRQVFKDSLIRQSTGDKKNPYRYFTTQEIRELFTLEDFRCSTTQTQLQSLHANQRKTDVELDEHIAYLYSLEIFGISDHDLMYVHETVEDDEPENEEAHRYIEGRIQKAQELVRLESQLKKQGMENIKNMSEATWLREMESFTQPKKKLPKSSLNHTFRPPGPPEPQSNSEPVILVSDDDEQGDDKNIINVSSRTASLIKDPDEEEITRDISNMEVSLQSKEEAQGADIYQCQQDQDASLVSPDSAVHSFSNKNRSPEHKTISSNTSAVSGSTINGTQVAYHQSLEELEISNPDVMYTHETLQENDPENEESHLIEDEIQTTQERIQLESQLKEQQKESIKNMPEETCLGEMESFTQPKKIPLKSPNSALMVHVTPEPKSDSEPVIILNDYDDMSDDKHIINLSSKMESLLKDLDEEEVTQDVSNMEVSLQSKEEAKGAGVYQCKEDHDASLILPISEVRSCSNKESCSPEPKATSVAPVSGSTIDGIQVAYHQSLERSEVSDPDLIYTPEMLQENELENEETQRYIEDEIQTTQERIESQLKEQQKESIKHMTEETCLVEMDSFTLPMKMPLKSPDRAFVIHRAAETKSDNEPVIILSDDDDMSDDKHIINLSSKRASLKDLDEETTQDISNMEVSLQKKEAEVTSVSQHEQPQDASLVSPISEVNSFSYKRNCSAESKALSHETSAVASNTSNDVKMTSLQLSFEKSFSKPLSNQKCSPSPILSRSQVYSASDMIPLFSAANTSCIFNDVQKAPQQQTLECTSTDAKRETRTEMSFGSPTVPPGQTGEALMINSAPAFQLQANKMSNFSVVQEGGISDITMENEFVDSPVVYGHFSLALGESEDSLQSEALMGDTVNSGFQLKLDSGCSSEAESWLGDTRDNKNLQANKSITGSIIVDCSNPTCDPSEDHSDVLSGHKKKLVRRIVSDNEEEEDHLVETDHRNVFMSTPKSSRPMAELYFSPQLKISRRRSTASRRSLADTVLDRVEDIAAAMEMSSNMTHERSFHSSPERDVNGEDSGQEWESSDS